MFRKISEIFRRVTALVLLLVLCAGPRVSAGPSGSASADGIPQIVVTTFPLYDWVNQIAAGSVNVTMLLDSGVDLHSFQPTAQDIALIGSCDLMIFVGGESDSWVDDALGAVPKPDRRTLNLMEALGSRALAGETVEGMEPSEENETEEDVPDEHIWLSLRNAKVLVEAITDALSEVNPSYAHTYAFRMADYAARLDELDKAYTDMVEGAKYHTLLFADRFPFRYLVADYGLDYYAAFSGCSAETEASFQTVVFLSGKLQELGLPAVLTIDGNNRAIAETLVQSTAGRQEAILQLNSLQSATLRDAQEGLTYLDAMASNLAVLHVALYGTMMEE